MTSLKAIKPINWFLMAVVSAALIWSGIDPHDRFTWFLEIFPALLGAAALLATNRRFKFSQLAYTLLFFHALVLIYGGKHTYALNPAFEWLKEALDLERNYYDRLGHFAQGFVPAVIVREVLLRTSPLTRGKWLFFIVTSICLAISAVYEFIEWWVAVGTGEAADAFLGTQGDVWDTQWDMFLATIGAMTLQISLRRWHDRSIARVDPMVPKAGSTANR